VEREIFFIFKKVELNDDILQKNISIKIICYGIYNILDILDIMSYHYIVICMHESWTDCIALL